jgi:hypothetical protein
MGKRAEEEKRSRGRPPLPESIRVYIAKEDFSKAYDLTGFRMDTPFRVVFQTLVSKAEVAGR